jgi:hypothetical protein
MTFKRLWNGTRGKLSDPELEHVMSLVRRDSVIKAAWNRLLAEGPAYDRDHPIYQDMLGDVMVELKRLSTAIYPHADPHDWFELELHLDAENANGL